MSDYGSDVSSESTAVVGHLEVLRVPADLVDVGQRAAVVRTLTPRQTQLLSLKLKRTNRRGNMNNQ